MVSVSRDAGPSDYSPIIIHANEFLHLHFSTFFYYFFNLPARTPAWETRVERHYILRVSQVHHLLWRVCLELLCRLNAIDVDDANHARVREALERRHRHGLHTHGRRQQNVRGRQRFQGLGQRLRKTKSNRHIWLVGRPQTGMTSESYCSMCSVVTPYYSTRYAIAYLSSA